MVQHRDLTGASLHEPKGADSATLGQVYVSDGAGSGTWQNVLSSIVNLNKFYASDVLDDISTPSDNFFYVVPQKATLTKVVGVLAGALTAADAVITMYKNGIAHAQTLTVPFTGSGAGVKTSFAISPALSVVADDVLEFRSDGGSTGTVSYSLTAQFTAVP